MSVTSFAPESTTVGPRPRPRPFGIFTVAEEIGDPRAIAGVYVEPYPCGPPDGQNPCATGEDRVKDTRDPEDRPFFAGFTAYVPITCTRSAVGDDETFKGKAAAAMEAGSAFIAEKQLAIGHIMPLNPTLSGAATTVTGTTYQDVLGLLEVEIDETGRDGVLHLASDVVTALGVDNLEKDGDVMRTLRGTPVIVGSGYPAGGMWATGPIQYQRSEVFTEPRTRAEALNRATNEVTYFAEQLMVIGWDGCLLVAGELEEEA